jgi:hypothetical protein
MRTAILLFVGALGVSPGAVSNAALPGPARTPAEITERYHAAVAAGDSAGLVKLWRDNERLVLPTIDRDLEDSLAAWEAATKHGSLELDDETAKKIGELTRRALFGAAAASEAFDRPIFADYASAFVSWSDGNKRDFRAGQAAFGEGRKALQDGELEAARDAGRRCTALALPLGDWWGTAMGLGLSGAAQLELGDTETALADLSRARLINQALGLSGAELQALGGMLACLEKLEHWARARTVCNVLISKSEGEERAALLARLESYEGK